MAKSASLFSCITFVRAYHILASQSFYLVEIQDNSPTCSMSQWIPLYVHRCQQWIHSALGDGGIFQQEFRVRKVVEESWILHNFDFNTFCIFGFLNNFALRTGRPAGEYSRLRAAIPDIQRAFYSVEMPGGDLMPSWLRGNFPKSARSHLRNSRTHVLHI